LINKNSLIEFSQENKRKVDQNDYSNKKLCHSSSSNENSKCETNLLDEELNQQKEKLTPNDEQQKLRSNLNQRLHKQSIIKS
jgi:DNA-binding transcriptional regulator GbsR (MarR family)